MGMEPGFLHPVLWLPGVRAFLLASSADLALCQRTPKLIAQPDFSPALGVLVAVVGIVVNIAS
jgi:hypothetical protein